MAGKKPKKIKADSTSYKLSGGSTKDKKNVAIVLDSLNKKKNKK